MRLGLVLLVVGSALAIPAEPKRVLILDSFGRDVAPFNAVVSVFRKTLARELGQAVDIHEAPLDMARFGDTADEQAFAEFLDKRFAGRPVDLVVPVGGPACQLVAHSRAGFLSRAPVLFAGADSRIVPPESLRSNATLVTQNVDLPGILGDLLVLRPETTNVAVVLGTSPLEKFWAGECRREWQPFTNRLGFEWLDALSLPRMRERVGRLPPGSFVLFLMLILDAEGVPYDQNEPLRTICTAANAPVYGYFQSQFGLGIVGGKLYQDREVGERAGRMAVRILRGESPSSLPAQSVAPTHAVYDWRQLHRWGISSERLPADSVVEFREPTFWEQYRWRLIGIVGLCLAQTGLILGLVVNRAKRKRADAELREAGMRLNLAADSAGAGLWSLDLASGEYWLTPKMREMLQMGPEERLTLERFLGLVHPEDRRPVRQVVEHVVRSQKEASVEYRIVLGDGSTRWMASRGRVRSEADGRPEHLTGVTVDITLRKQGEEARRNLSARLIRAQEEERERLARELHDDITQRLARLSIDVARCEAGTPSEAPAEVARGVREGLIRLSEDVHALSYRLHPSILKDLGLGPALRAEAEHLERQEGLPVEVSLPDLAWAVPSDTALCLFRVAQEALRNALRHARAKRLKLTLREWDGGLQVAVQDDGCGFDPALVRERPSLGLASMRERVSLLSGELEIESAPGLGTTVLAWVPRKWES